MSIYGYLRVSSDTQTVESQKVGVLDYCKTHNITIEKWVEETVSGVKEIRKRKIGGLLPNLKGGDTLIVSELSRLGRSVSMVAAMTEKLVKRGVKIILVKQGLTLGEEDGIAGAMAQAFVHMGSIFAEMERSLLIARVKEGIRRKAQEGYTWNSGKKGMSYNCKSKNATLREKAAALYRKGKSVYYIHRKLKVSYITARKLVVAAT
ncbi:recombinase family protein [bacterium]|nr:recombinase family protein [bacterium]